MASPLTREIWAACVVSTLLFVLNVACGNDDDTGTGDGDTDTDADTDTDTDTDTDADPGTLTLEIWGEDYCETGLPSNVFADGWSVVFDKFLVNLSSVTITGSGMDPAIEITTPMVWDLVKQGPHVIAVEKDAPAGTYNQSHFTTGAATSQSTAGNAEASDVEAMIDGGYVYWIAGTATKDATTKTFNWGFTLEKSYVCSSIGVLEGGGEVTVQFTIHVDHVFTTNLSTFTNHFQEIADSDADQDGEVTQAELEQVTSGYDGGPYFDAKNFWDYLLKESAYLGHVDGEQECL